MLKEKKNKQGNLFLYLFKRVKTEVILLQQMGRQKANQVKKFGSERNRLSQP